MTPRKCLVGILLLLLVISGLLLISPGHTAIQAEENQEITVTMYALRQNGSIDWDQPEPLCQPSDPSTPQTETDKRYGCTAFDEVNHPQDIRPYPYPANPVAVSI